MAQAKGTMAEESCSHKSGKIVKYWVLWYSMIVQVKTSNWVVGINFRPKNYTWISTPFYLNRLFKRIGGAASNVIKH